MQESMDAHHAEHADNSNIGIVSHGILCCTMLQTTAYTALVFQRGP